jgi:hypothetical protein
MLNGRGEGLANGAIGHSPPAANASFQRAYSSGRIHRSSLHEPMVLAFRGRPLRGMTALGTVAHRQQLLNRIG